MPSTTPLRRRTAGLAFLMVVLTAGVVLMHILPGHGTAAVSVVEAEHDGTHPGGDSGQAAVSLAAGICLAVVGSLLLSIGHRRGKNGPTPLRQWRRVPVWTLPLITTGSGPPLYLRLAVLRR